MKCWKAILGKLKVVPEGLKVVLDGLKAGDTNPGGRLGEPARG